MFGRKPPSQPAPTRFGEAAVAMGLARPTDVQKALRIQAHRRDTGQNVPLLGEVLEGLGVLKEGQVDAVFNRLLEGEPAEPQKKPAPAKRPSAPPKTSAKPTAAGWWDRLKSLAG